MPSKLRIAIWTAAGIVLAVSLYLGATLYFERQATEEITRFVADSRLIQEMQYDEMHVDLFRREIGLGNVRVQTAYISSPVRIASIAIRIDQNDADRQKGQIRCNSIQLPLDRQWIAAIDPILKDLGYAEIQADLDIRYQIDRSLKTCRFEAIHLSVKDAFQMTIDVGLDGVFPEEIPRIIQNPFLLLKDSQNAALQQLRIVYDDASLFSRVAEATARKRGISGKDQIASWAQEIDRQISLSQAEVSKAIWQAAGDFLRNPQRIGIRMQPSSPVLFRDMVLLSMMKGPEAVLQQLGIQLISS